MSKINKYNYEAVLLDFAEGKLSSAETDDLLNFLAAHPEYNEDLDTALEIIELDEESELKFSRKNELFRSDTQEITQNLIIAHLEGVASGEEMKELESLRVSNPLIEKEITVFSRLTLQPDAQILFSHKESLLQTATVSFSAWFYRISLAAAAVLLLFLTVKTENESQVQDYRAMAKLKVKSLDLLPSHVPSQKIDESNFVQDKYPVNLVQVKRKPIFELENEKNIPEDIGPVFVAEQIAHLEHLPVLDTFRLIEPRTTLADISFSNNTKEEPDENYIPGFLNLLTQESTALQTSFGFATTVSNKIKNFAGDFQKVDEIELKFWGMRTTIHKPSWMKWRRKNIK